MSRNARALTLGTGLLVLWLLAQWLGREIVEPEWAASFPDDLWTGESVNELTLSENEARVLGVDHYRFFEWHGAGPRVWMYVGYYAGQRSNSQVHAPEHCYPGTGWEIVRQTTREQETAALRELRIQHQGNSRLVWYGYRTRLGAPISAFGLKLRRLPFGYKGRREVVERKIVQKLVEAMQADLRALLDRETKAANAGKG